MNRAPVQRKRSNACQMEYMVEKIYANRTMALGNWGDSQIKAEWVALADELNRLGCARTAEEWRNIWTTWVTKVRGKARKVRASVTGTGGGPSIAPLTDLDEKILEITGRAAVYGFAAMETEVMPSVPPQPLPEAEMGDLPQIYLSPGRLVEDREPELIPSPVMEVTPTPDNINFGTGSTPNFSRARESQPHPYSRPRRRIQPSRVQRLDTSAVIAAVRENGQLMRENGQLMHQGLMAIAEALRALAPVQNSNGVTGNP